ncbi:MAG: 6-phosphogluconolactonase [Spirochaetes bacterium]|nr:6-phosphogluconolactonase [Spirochaetota bacterium]
MKKRVLNFVEPREMNLSLSEYIRSLCEKTLKSRKIFTIAFSGGESPKSLFGVLSRSTGFKELWKNIHIFQVDERFISDTDPDNNFYHLNSLLLRRIDIPKENIHRILPKVKSPSRSAIIYEKEIRRILKKGRMKKMNIIDGFPVFDLILLGVGKDGHTASLFPEDFRMEYDTKWVKSVPAPEKMTPSVSRITITLPVINNARNVVFLVSRKGKEKIMDMILDQKENRQYPAARVDPKGGSVWYISKS